MTERWITLEQWRLEDLRRQAEAFYRTARYTVDDGRVPPEFSEVLPLIGRGI